MSPVLFRSSIMPPCRATFLRAGAPGRAGLREYACDQLYIGWNMRTILKNSAFGTAGASILCLAYLSPIFAQTTSSRTKPVQAPSPADRAAAAEASGKKILMAEDVFSNVQALKGIPVNEFMETMGMFAASLALNCSDCHSAEALSDWSRYADDVPRKRTARRMILMVKAINQTNFGGRNVVTCYT